MKISKSGIGKNCFREGKRVTEGDRDRDTEGKKERDSETDR